MICYASQTGTKRNLKALREAGWRILLSAAGRLKPFDFSYALDNGAWHAFQQNKPFDVGAFETAVDRVGSRADWIVCPDIVAGGLRSLEFSAGWLPQLKQFKVLLAVQDGMHPRDVVPFLGPNVGIFLGGSTPWKLQTMEAWGHLAAALHIHYHVARVNTARRIALAIGSGAHSIDGSSATRYAKTLPLLQRATRTSDLFRPTAGFDQAAIDRAVAYWLVPK
jgi:hypothetical protein